MLYYEEYPECIKRIQCSCVLSHLSLSCTNWCSACRNTVSTQSLSAPAPECSAGHPARNQQTAQTQKEHKPHVPEKERWGYLCVLKLQHRFINAINCWSVLPLMTSVLLYRSHWHTLRIYDSVFTTKKLHSNCGLKFWGVKGFEANLTSLWVCHIKGQALSSLTTDHFVDVQSLPFDHNDSNGDNNGNDSLHATHQLLKEPEASLMVEGPGGID